MLAHLFYLIVNVLFFIWHAVKISDVHHIPIFAVVTLLWIPLEHLSSSYVTPWLQHKRINNPSLYFYQRSFFLHFSLSLSSPINNDAPYCFFHSITRFVLQQQWLFVTNRLIQRNHSCQTFSFTFRSITVINIIDNVVIQANQYPKSTRSQNSSGCYQSTTRKYRALVRDYLYHLVKVILFF